MPSMELASPSSSSPTTPSSSEDSSSLASSAKVLSYPHGWTHERVPHFGSRLSVVDFGGRQPFFIGTQVAALLKRETFNMYRSMKIKMVDLDRATAEQVEFLCQVGAVRAGTHSVTLIPYQEGLYFIADAWIRQHKSELVYCNRARSRTKSFMLERPKLHRRKPHPWNVHRALKREDLAHLDGDSLTLLRSASTSSLKASGESISSRTDSLDDEHDILASLLQHSSDSLSASASLSPPLPEVPAPTATTPPTFPANMFSDHDASAYATTASAF